MKQHPRYNGYLISEDGKVYSEKNKRYLTQTPYNGYLKQSLYIPKKGTVTEYVHRLVAETYLPNPYECKFVNHKDGNKHNNSVDNLEWVLNKKQKKQQIKDSKEEEYKDYLTKLGYLVLDQDAAKKLFQQIRSM